MMMNNSILIIIILFIIIINGYKNAKHKKLNNKYKNIQIYNII